MYVEMDIASTVSQLMNTISEKGINFDQRVEVYVENQSITRKQRISQMCVVKEGKARLRIFYCEKSFVLIIVDVVAVDQENYTVVQPWRGVAYRKVTIELWQFLVTLLYDERFKYVLQWHNEYPHFKILAADELAILWGWTKNKENMTYDKLTRAMRPHMGVESPISKHGTDRFVYRFNNDIIRERMMRNPELIENGHTA